MKEEVKEREGGRKGKEGGKGVGSLRQASAGGAGGTCPQQFLFSIVCILLQVFVGISFSFQTYYFMTIKVININNYKQQKAQKASKMLKLLPDLTPCGSGETSWEKGYSSCNMRVL